MKTIDNINIKLVDDLKESFKSKSKLSIAASSFTIYAFEALRKELQSVDEVRFIFTSPTFLAKNLKKEVPKFFIPHLFKEAELCGGDFELRLRNQLTQRAIAKECSKWVKEKVKFKSNKNFNYQLQSMMHLKNKENEFAWTGLNGFTTPDLGISANDGFPSFINKIDYPNASAYLNWFNQVWKDQQNLEEVTKKVEQYFEKAFKDNSPEYIYFVILYNIFNDFLDDLNLDNMPDDRVGFKETEIWKRLYNFQKDAVIGAINKLEKYKGCILADSVGLGKTFSALGVIKYYEMRNKDVLVLCPKKLEHNWNTYRHNDINNILAKDRLRYEVLFHTDLSREKGMSNGRNLNNVNWGNYGLVVIDESHNFRNSGLTYSDKENRYQKLLRKVMKEGIETKVLMLSATPVNNRFNDLKNQLALAYEGEAQLMDNRLELSSSIEHIFRSAQKAFNTWSKLPIRNRTAEVLLEHLDFDFFELLDALTIARSRKHITSYYDTTDIGKFPKRNPPVSIQEKLCSDGSLKYEEIASQLSFLNLSIYTPLKYILSSKVEKYAKRYDKEIKNGTFKQSDREDSLRKLMQINFLKRLESSIDSFRITIQGVLDQIDKNLEVISNYNENLQYQVTNIDIDNENFDWEEEWGEDETVLGNKVKVELADVDRTRWMEDLESDRKVISTILKRANKIKPKQDTKLQSLIRNIENKINNPYNSNNKKVIVFTAFADTANYLYENIESYFKEKYQLNTALITGSRRTSSSNNIPADTNVLLSCFSPFSKDKALLYPTIEEEIDILIATDCISEGQNLQDCDHLINYDIHWNPVRIIQRFGRIDRIGSKNETITLVNFWPDITLDAYINLKQRVESKMIITDLASTADDNILQEGDAANQELEYRKIQLQKLQESVSDLEDLREGIDITDLGLNDFRIDLSNFVKSYGDLMDIPEGIHTIVKSTEHLRPGVIFVLKNINEKVNINKQNRLHPFYMVYIDQNNEVICKHTDSKKTLDAIRMLCKGIKEPITDLCEIVSKETEDYHNMSLYSEKLQSTIKSILQTEEDTEKKKEIMSLFTSGGTITNAKKELSGIADFKLISFLIVK